MQQRVGLARALAVEPKVLLMDEPFAALDAITRETLRRDLLKLWSRRRTAIVFVTHDIDEAIFLSQRIVLLRPRPGSIDEILDVRFPDPRWEKDPRALPEFAALREHLWDRIRDMLPRMRSSRKLASAFPIRQRRTGSQRGPARAVGSRWRTDDFTLDGAGRTL